LFARGAAVTPRRSTGAYRRLRGLRTNIGDRDGAQDVQLKLTQRHPFINGLCQSLPIFREQPATIDHHRN
jgi:hypothetical protein